MALNRRIAGLMLASATALAALPVVHAGQAEAAPSDPIIDVRSISMAMSEPEISVSREDTRYYDRDCLFAGTGTDDTTVKSVWGFNSLRPWNNADESWVTATPGREARVWSYVSHGMPAYGPDVQSCPERMSIEFQSSVGVKPQLPRTVRAGETFPIGKIRHNNKYMWASEDPYGRIMYFFHGAFQINMGGKVDTFPWDQWETPNRCNYKVDSEQKHCSDDILYINKASSNKIYYDQNGVKYFLNIWGFYKTDSNGVCPAHPEKEVPRRKFITSEYQSTEACIYASLNPQRTITIKKQVHKDGELQKNFSMPSFNFSVTNRKSPADPFALSPTGWDKAGESQGHELVFHHGFDMPVVKESLPPADNSAQWAFRGVTCEGSDGKSVELPSNAIDSANASLDLGKLNLPNSAADNDLVCTFHNYLDVPSGSLEIAKRVDGSVEGLKAGSKFAFDYNCTAPRNAYIPDKSKLRGTVQVEADKSQTVAPLPVGANCEVVERKPSDELLKSNHHFADPETKAPVQIERGRTAKVEFVNRIEYVAPKRPVTILKVGTNGPLEGSKFQIFDKEGLDATPIQDGVKPLTGRVGVFTTTDLEVNKTYWIRETVAPFGHQLLPNPIKFQLKENGIELEGEAEQGAVGARKTGEFEITVKDTEVGTLPKAGGLGQWPYALAGLALAGAGLALTRRTKRH